MAADDVILELIRQHIEDDRRNFDAQHATLAEIKSDVKSLLETRAQSRGIGKIIAAAAGSSGLISLLFEYFKRH